MFKKELAQHLINSLLSLRSTRQKLHKLFFLHITKQCFTRQPNPERGYLWKFKKIIHEHLWLIDGYL